MAELLVAYTRAIILSALGEPFETFQCPPLPPPARRVDEPTTVSIATGVFFAAVAIVMFVIGAIEGLPVAIAFFVIGLVCLFPAVSYLYEVFGRYDDYEAGRSCPDDSVVARQAWMNR